MSSGLFENVIYKMCFEILYLIYMYEKDLALKKTYNVSYAIKTNQTKSFIMNKSNSFKRKYVIGISCWYLLSST